MARKPARPTTCPRCGAHLARDNTTGRCAPCQAAERDRLVAPPTLPDNFWEHEPIRQAATERHVGRLIRAYRSHPYHGRHPLPQETVARWLGIAQAQLSRIEHGRPIVHLDRLTHWAQILRIPAHLLWFKLPDEEPQHGPVAEVDKARVSTATVAASVDDGGDTTNRRSLVVTAALASLNMTEQLGALLTSAGPQPRLGHDHLQPVLSAVDRFEQADAAVGGNELCDFAIALHQQVSRWERECCYDRDVADALQAVLGDLECWIGWFALDAERRPESQRYLHEAIVRARLRDDPQLEVRSLACLSLLIREAHPHESSQCAEAARRISAGWATPRLKALLHLRAARANATLGDATGFDREMAKALSEFDHGEHEDDPLYIRFLTPMEVIGIEGLSQLALGNAARATRSFQRIIDNPDPEYRRNQVYYRVQLASAMLRQRDVDGASQLALDATPEVAALRSNRTSRLLSALRTDLGGIASRSTLARQFVVTYDEAVRA